jgi:quercetin dioxygenase-like cupin family protein
MATSPEPIQRLQDQSPAIAPGFFFGAIADGALALTLRLSISSSTKKENAMTGTAKATVHVDNERVIVTEYRFAPGANTGWHRHGHDYVVVPLMDGKVKLLTKEGESFAEMKQGAPYFRREGVEHDVINANDGEYAFIEIELK